MKADFGVRKEANFGSSTRKFRLDTPGLGSQRPAEG